MVLHATGCLPIECEDQRPRGATVESVDAGRIVLKPDEDDPEGSNVDIINLIKSQRSNQNTCINQRPIVRPGDHV